MVNKVCPQRILKEAMELLMLIPVSEEPNSELEERISNNHHELESLSRALYRDGIINIVEAPSYGC